MFVEDDWGGILGNLPQKGLGSVMIGSYFWPRVKALAVFKETEVSLIPENYIFYS